MQELDRGVCLSALHAARQRRLSAAYAGGDFKNLVKTQMIRGTESVVQRNQLLQINSLHSCKLDLSSWGSRNKSADKNHIYLMNRYVGAKKG